MALLPAAPVRQAPAASPLPLPWPTSTCCRGRHAQERRQHAAAAQLRAAGRRRLAVATAALPETAASKSEAGNATAQALAGLRYTSPDGQWAVRPMNKTDTAEVRRVVALQTDAFHTAAPLPMLDGMAKRFFQAEVLSEMQKKLRFNPDDMFVSLVIEPAADSSSDCGGGGGGGVAQPSPGVVGVVEVSYIGQKETLALLEPGTEGYCYIASMVVAPSWRRRGAAAALLAAAEAAAAAWSERQALLHVYQDNAAAIQLYRRAGYEVLHGQGRLWGAVGARPRYLMRKRW